MDGWTTTMRELTAQETALVSGAFTWTALGSAMATGAIVGGLGAAAFHPPAAALAHRFGGTRKGLAMSVHITGGSLGFSLGPLVCTMDPATGLSQCTTRLSDLQGYPLCKIYVAR